MAEGGTGNASVPLAPPPPDAPPPASAEVLEVTSVSTAVVVLLLVVWQLVCQRVQSRYLTDGNLAALMGLGTGLLLLLFSHYVEKRVLQSLLVFDSSTFLVYLLPPVILNAGLRIPEAFFSNLGTILCMGIGGTIISFGVISVVLYAFTPFHVLHFADCLALGAIFSATDSVATLQVLKPDAMPLLFSLVFGEGVINDATSVVLLGAVSAVYPPAGTVQAPSDAATDAAPAGSLTNAFGVVGSFLYLFSTSVVVGLATGAAIVWLLLFFKSSELSASKEMSLVGMLSYLSYLLAEVSGLSGILSLFCCGTCVSHWALPRMSQAGSVTTLVAFDTLSHLAEGIIFIYVGMDALDPHKWDMTYPGEAIPMCVVLLSLLLSSRALAVIPMSLLHNLWGEDQLSARDLVIIWWSGLMRGAVSVALVYFYFDASTDPHHATVITSTLLVVLVTTVAFGAATKPLLILLLEERPDDPLTTVLAEKLAMFRRMLERLPPPPPWLQCCLPCIGPRVYQQLREMPLHDTSHTRAADTPTPGASVWRSGDGSSGGGVDGAAGIGSGGDEDRPLGADRHGAPASIIVPPNGGGIAASGAYSVAAHNLHRAGSLSERTSPQHLRRPSLSAASMRTSTDGSGGGGGSPTAAHRVSAAVLLTGQRSAPLPGVRESSTRGPS